MDEVFSFHLLGGVTPAEAEAIEAVHKPHWTHCKCGRKATAVILLRGPSGRRGDVQGTALCAEHEGVAIDLIQQSPGYQGARVDKIRRDE